METKSTEHKHVHKLIVKNIEKLSVKNVIIIIIIISIIIVIISNIIDLQKKTFFKAQIITGEMLSSFIKLMPGKIQA